MRRAIQFAAIIAGALAWYAIVIAVDYLLVRILELPSGGRFALLGATQLLLGGSAVFLALRLAGLLPSDVGWTSKRIRSDLAIGLVTAALFAALQFLVLIPATGGAERSDIIANAAQIGETPTDLAGVLTLALLGSTSEELLFRGLLLGGAAAIAGGSTLARVLSTLLVVILFAFSHGYQGWAGVVDTGIYGGLVLSLLYWWRGSRLAAPIAAHVGWNVTAAAVIFTFY